MTKAVIRGPDVYSGAYTFTVDGVLVGKAWRMDNSKQWFFELEDDFIPSGMYFDWHPDANAVGDFAVLCYNEAMSKKS